MAFLWWSGLAGNTNKNAQKSLRAMSKVCRTKQTLSIRIGGRHNKLPRQCLGVITFAPRFYGRMGKISDPVDLLNKFDNEFDNAFGPN